MIKISFECNSLPHPGRCDKTEEFFQELADQGILPKKGDIVGIHLDDLKNIDKKCNTDYEKQENDGETNYYIDFILYLPDSNKIVIGSLEDKDFKED